MTEEFSDPYDATGMFLLGESVSLAVILLFIFATSSVDFSPRFISAGAYVAGFVCQDCGTKTIVSLGSCQHDESFPKPPPHVSD